MEKIQVLIQNGPHYPITQLINVTLEISSPYHDASIAKLDFRLGRLHWESPIG